MAQSERLSVSARNKLITLLPRLRRFATLLAGDEVRADSLLRAACKKILDKGHTYQQGTAFDVRAFSELHGAWLSDLRSHETPISQGQADASAFERAGQQDDGHFSEIAEILAHLPPQQRSAALLVYGDGFSYEEAGRILDTPHKTVIARVSRALASFIDRADWIDSAGLYGAKVEQLKQINGQAG